MLCMELNPFTQGDQPAEGEQRVRLQSNMRCTTAYGAKLVFLERSGGVLLLCAGE